MIGRPERAGPGPEDARARSRVPHGSPHRGLVHERKGACGEAIGAYTRAETRAELAHALATCGRRPQARAILDEPRRPGQTRFVNPADLAMVHVGLEEPEEALALLEKAYVQRLAILSRVRVDPQFAALRPHPRFQDLLRRMNLPPADPVPGRPSPIP